jgi:hypothetical protein
MALNLGGGSFLVSPLKRNQISFISPAFLGNRSRISSKERNNHG